MEWYDMTHGFKKNLCNDSYNLGSWKDTHVKTTYKTPRRRENRIILHLMSWKNGDIPNIVMVDRYLHEDTH